MKRFILSLRDKFKRRTRTVYVSRVHIENDIVVGFDVTTKKTKAVKFGCKHGCNAMQLIQVIAISQALFAAYSVLPV